jgi:cysteine desulfurase / selenocysteine lyase
MKQELTSLRAEFPALRPRSDGTAPAYLDSACMSLVPRPVLDAMEEYYRDFPGCAGRSLHRFAEEVGHRYEAAREAFAHFLHAPSPSSVVFLRNATEAINLVAQGIAWKRGDRVLITDQEHNSNLVVWQRVAREKGVRLGVLPLSSDGSFEPAPLETFLERGVRLVSFFETSNLDGRTLPIREIAARVHDAGGELMVDGCQSAPHRPVDLERLGVDYYALSAHKLMGPTGTGLLAGRPELLEKLRPLLLGGETVEWSTLTDHALRPVPHRLEAGLQNYAGILGAHAAIVFLQKVGYEAIEHQTRRLNQKVSNALKDNPRVTVLGPADAADRPSIYAFSLDGVDSHAAALFLDEAYSVLVRSGMHCVHSWYRARGLDGNVRASFYLYNTDEEADRLVAGIRELLERIPAASGTSAPAAAVRSGPAASSPGRAAESSKAAARSAPPRGRVARGRAASGGGSG